MRRPADLFAAAIPCLLVLLVGCSAPDADHDSAVATPDPAVSTAKVPAPLAALEGAALVDYQVALSEHWQAYETGLRRPDGWLSLTGLHWLEDGENACGGDPSVAVALPAERAPAQVGTFTLNGGVVSFTPSEGVAVTLDGAPLTGPTTLATDADEEASLLTFGTLEWYVIVRGDQYGVRVRDRANPALASFAGLDIYPVDATWRVAARFEPYDPPRVVAVPTVLGTTTDIEAPGAFVFIRDGAEHRLDALDAGDELWLIFGDETNGSETYGGGRFLYTARPDAEGVGMIDFNRAYNPPCAYSAFATCPLPPAQNKLRLAVPVGEKLPPGGVPH